MPRFRPHITAMKAYHPPLEGRTSTADLLLDFNERSAPLPQPILDTLAEWCRAGRTQVYPEYSGLLPCIAAYTGVPESHLLFGNGSDQLIDCIFRAVVEPGQGVALPAPSFAMYAQCAQLAGARIEEYDMLAADPCAALRAALERPGVVLALVSQPNNPTGHLLNTEWLIQEIRRHPDIWFIVDEAYYEFSRETLLDRLRPLPANLVVLRTFSKVFGLAALRIGYLAADTSMVEQLLKIRGPYDVNQLAGQAAALVLRHREVVLRYATEVMEHCKPRVEEVLRKKKIDFLPSHANYLLLPGGEARLGALLREQGLRARAMTHPRLAGAIRISIGGKETLAPLLEALRKA